MKKFFISVLSALGLSNSSAASTLVDKPAPLFELKNQDDQLIRLKDRKSKGYTVVFFYPKADTPGCTKQACAFRDSIDKIRDKNAEVYGISADTVGSQKKFHDKHKMKFDLLADSDSKTIKQYGIKMPALPLAKRHTFIIDPDLKVVRHFPDVDPVMDASNVAKALEELQKGKG
jgi:peroxiredoxin Q/BCP